MIHFNDKLWNIHQICVLQVLNEKKKDNSSKKSRNFGQGKKLCRDIVSECCDIISIEPVEFCRDKD